MTDNARPALTISEAAEAAHVNRRTIRRRLDAGDFPGAYRDAPGTSRGPTAWRIPVTDLLAAGFTLHAPTPPEDTPQGQPGPDPSGTPRDLDRLRTEVAELRRRAEVAEAIAEERGRALDDARLALRALTAGPPVTPEPATVATPTPTSSPTKNATPWWQPWRR